MLRFFREKETFAANDFSWRSQYIWVFDFLFLVTMLYRIYLNNKKMYDLLEKKIQRNVILVLCRNFIITSKVINNNELLKMY